jgi:quinol monooxygenase YgiN
VATILAHITVNPGAEARFEAIAKALYEGTHQHETGVLRYEYWRGAQPSTYYTLLSFEDFNTFINHQVSPHHETAAAEFGEVFAALTLEWVDPISSSSPLPATDSQPLPADADELFVRYHQRYAAQVAEWWHDLR